MQAIGEEFIFLQASQQELRGSGVLTRSLGILVGQDAVMAAIDVNGRKHLLVPSGGAPVSADASSQGVTLGSRRLRVGGRDVDFIDLECRMDHLDLVFERLLEDLLRRLEHDSSAPVMTVRHTLDEWRALLRSAGRPLDRETVVGLVGELEVLRCMAERNASTALDAWRGPAMAVHDFVHGGSELEVKTTTSVDGNFITIANLDQLDPCLVRELHLVVVHVRDDESAPTLDERLDGLIRLGLGRDALLERVERAGYVYESDPAVGRLAIRSVRAWRVGESFPGLRGSDLNEARRKGVSKVRYELALDAAPPRLTDAEFESLLDRWLQ